MIHDFFTGAEEYGQGYWGKKFVKEYANCRLSRDSFIKLIPLFFYYKEKDTPARVPCFLLKDKLIRFLQIKRCNRPFKHLVNALEPL